MRSGSSSTVTEPISTTATWAGFDDSSATGSETAAASGAAVSVDGASGATAPVPFSTGDNGVGSPAWISSNRFFSTGETNVKKFPAVVLSPTRCR